MPPPEPLPFKLRLKQLREQQQMTQEDLAFATREHGRGMSTNSIRVYEKGTSRPGVDAFRMLAGALGIDPADFPEYRLLLMREALDEKIAGLEGALANLAALEGATSRASAAPASPARAGRPKPLHQRHTHPASSAPRKKREAS